MKGFLIMFNAIKNILVGFWELLKLPLLFVFILFMIFGFILFLFFLKEFASGKRPEPTSVRHVKRPGFFRSVFIMTPRQIVKDYFNRPADFFDPQGLIIFTGRQGRGKTVAMAEYLLYLQDSYPLCKCLTNFAYKHEDVELQHWRQLTDFKNGVKGVVVGIDEMQNWFSSNQSKNFPPEMLAVITQNRKNRRIILGTSQNFYLLAKAIRSQATEVRECMTFFRCFTMVFRKEAILDDKGDVKEWKRRGFYYFVHTPRIRESYDTYRVIESLVDSGFKEETRISIEQV